MKSTHDNPDAFERLLATYGQELRAMSDDDVLDGCDPVALKSAALEQLDAAKAEAGKRRLATAKEAAKRQQSGPTHPVPAVTPTEARAYLQKAANDRRYTLAARELDEMSDADMLALYTQLKSIEHDSEGSEDDPA